MRATIWSKTGWAAKSSEPAPLGLGRQQPLERLGEQGPVRGFQGADPGEMRQGVIVPGASLGSRPASEAFAQAREPFLAVQVDAVARRPDHRWGGQVVKGGAKGPWNG